MLLRRNWKKTDNAKREVHIEYLDVKGVSRERAEEVAVLLLCPRAAVPRMHVFHIMVIMCKAFFLWCHASLWSSGHCNDCDVPCADGPYY